MRIVYYNFLFILYLRKYITIHYTNFNSLEKKESDNFPDLFVFDIFLRS